MRADSLTVADRIVPSDAPALALTLRDVQPARPPAEPERSHEFDGLVQSDPEARRAPWLGDPQAERAEQRDARRAQVRRDRRREVTAEADASTPPAMLVLSEQRDEDGMLCQLLRSFGFAVQVRQTLPDLPAPWPFVAVFVDRSLQIDGSDAIELCHQTRERSRLPGERRPLLMLSAASLSATDRVRAGLAGCNEMLVGPVTRGALAAALDARGIALPSDARRA
jgi:CheY-like chemotaxis protein